MGSCLGCPEKGACSVSAGGGGWTPGLGRREPPPGPGAQRPCARLCWGLSAPGGTPWLRWRQTEARAPVRKWGSRRVWGRAAPGVSLACPLSRFSLSLPPPCLEEDPTLPLCPPVRVVPPRRRWQRAVLGCLSVGASPTLRGPGLLRVPAHLSGLAACRQVSGQRKTPLADKGPAPAWRPECTSLSRGPSHSPCRLSDCLRRRDPLAPCDCLSFQ